MRPSCLSNVDLPRVPPSRQEAFWKWSATGETPEFFSPLCVTSALASQWTLHVAGLQGQWGARQKEVDLCSMDSPRGLTLSLSLPTPASMLVINHDGSAQDLRQKCGGGLSVGVIWVRSTFLRCFWGTQGCSWRCVGKPSWGVSERC